jgi:acyl-CoA thioesterase I
MKDAMTMIKNRNAAVMAIALGIVVILPVCRAKADIVPELESGRNLKLCAVGTSLTSITQNGHNGWFDQTGAWLNGLPYPGKVTLSNRAVSGSASNTADGGFNQLAQVLNNDSPDAIFIEFAINDAYASYNISLEASKSNLQTMIDEINAWAHNNTKTVDIIVQTTNNCTGDAASKRPQLSDYYDGYRSVVQANPGVLLIDTNRAWLSLYNGQADHATWNSYVPDGVHPSSTGAANVILPVVQAALLSQAPEPSMREYMCWLLIIGVVSMSGRAWRRSKLRFVVG